MKFDIRAISEKVYFFYFNENSPIIFFSVISFTFRFLLLFFLFFSFLSYCLSPCALPPSDENRGDILLPSSYRPAQMLSKNIFDI